VTETIAHPSITRIVDGIELPQAGTYALDASHSHVGFAVRHMMVSKVRGQFTKFSGTVNIAADPAESSVEVEVDLASIDTNDEKRDGHLRSNDFFDTDSHRSMTFRSTDLRRGKGDRWILTGDLTLNDVTRTVDLEVSYEGAANTPWGATSIGFSATGKINREDFGVNWNQALEAGGFLVGKEIVVGIYVEAIRQKEG